MRALRFTAQPVAAVALLVFFPGCINWADAEASYCATALGERRRTVCDLHNSTDGASTTLTRLEAMAGRPVDLAPSRDGAWMLQRFQQAQGRAQALVRLSRTPPQIAWTHDFGSPASVAQESKVAQLASFGDESALIAASVDPGEPLPNGVTVELGTVYLAEIRGPNDVGRMRTVGESGALLGTPRLAHASGRIALAGQALNPSVKVDGTLYEVGLEGSLVLVLDSELNVVSHVATADCATAIIDDVAVSPGGAVFVSGRGTDSADAPCTLGAVALSEADEQGTRSFVARIDPGPTGTVAVVSWMAPVADRFRRPRLAVDDTTVTLLEDEQRQRIVQWTPNPITYTSALIRRLSVADGSLQDTQRIGAARGIGLTGGGEFPIWFAGTFNDDSVEALGFHLGPFERARHALLVRLGATSTENWAQAVVSTDTELAPTALAVEDTQGAVFMAGEVTGTIRIREHELATQAAFLAQFE